MSLGVTLGIAAFVFSLVTVVVRYRLDRGSSATGCAGCVWSVVVIVAFMVAGSVFPVTDYVEQRRGDGVPPVPR